MIARAQPADVYNAKWIARVKARCVVDANGCWLWQGFRNHKGYGYTTFRSRPVACHRQMLKLTMSVALKTEEFACHRCDVRNCCNPEHLFVGSTSENQQDSIAKRRQRNTKKTHCWRGHPLSGDNVNIVPAGRQCKACCVGNHRVRVGWPEDLAYSLPPRAKLPPGVKRLKYKLRHGRKEHHREVIGEFT